MGWARPARARTSPTSRRRWPRPSSGVPRPFRPADLGRPAQGEPLIKLPEGGEEIEYLRDRRDALGGYLPARRRRSPSLAGAAAVRLRGAARGDGDRENSTTMVFVRILNMLLRDKKLGTRVVPIVPRRSATFGMEGMFRQFGIFTQVGQLYRPQDANQLMFYKEDQKGQVLQEGINEPGPWRPGSRRRLVQHQRLPDDPVLHLLLDVRLPAGRRPRLGGRRHPGPGVPPGGTAGRTTLNGEGLQHQDGHSHILSSLIPNCVSYTRPSPMSSPSSSRTACGGCTGTRRTSSTT